LHRPEPGVMDGGMDGLDTVPLFRGRCFRADVTCETLALIQKNGNQQRSLANSRIFCLRMPLVELICANVPLHLSASSVGM
jgi:hypothetical protein